MSLDVCYTTRSQKSKDKCHRFFGSDTPSIVVGGSRTKLSSFYGAQCSDAIEMDKETLVSPISPIHSKDHPVLHLPRLFHSHKVLNVLGDSCPVDVSLAMIDEGGLSALLESCFPLCYFLGYLISQNNAELLFFVLDIQAFEQSIFPTRSDCEQHAQRIFHSYFDQGALFELNVSYKSKRAVANGVKSASHTCFRPAVNEIMILLEDAFHLFKASPVYTAMEQHLSFHAVSRTGKQVDVVVDFLGKCMPTKRPETIQWFEALEAFVGVLVDQRISIFD